MQFIRGNWINPASYQAMLEKWKHDKTTLNVLITGTPVNIDMYLEDYNITYTGGFGDFNYEVKFVEIISLTIITKKKTKKKSTKKTSSSSSRGTKSSGTYTVKKGDCLWNIASKKLGKGSRWKEIYNLNKSTIEKAAKKHGRKSSSNGHWIYPGTKLKLPKK
ncbi:LysM peptidoglycan-binding domain-containing protein [Clostridiales Family XIII bacterium ASD5510]|uniref:LysM peptidoglycan-binding domain-containing protein n=1 Tax=Hominibacterium faecale TaxID=2839743 RepID=A0A9J6QYI6_9FIRM|nr:LysM peptidoglycan-binding domain-containing protein [Hominibacterium faecale]MCU7380522.1 LysM peptidoglycan-binding domain-containing protein [Hominibacterium faecale]